MNRKFPWEMYSKSWCTIGNSRGLQYLQHSWVLGRIGESRTSIHCNLMNGLFAKEKREVLWRSYIHTEIISLVGECKAMMLFSACVLYVCKEIMANQATIESFHRLLSILCFQGFCLRAVYHTQCSLWTNIYEQIEHIPLPAMIITRNEGYIYL